MIDGAVRLLLWFMLAFQTGMPGTSEALNCRIVFTQIPARLGGHADRLERNFLANQAAGPGSRIASLSPDGTLANLTPEFAAAADPGVAFDSRRILFAGKRAAADRWNIWEMDADGRSKRQITANLGDCREPEYLAMSSITPPDFDAKVRWITFTSSAAGAQPAGGREPVSSLYVTSLEPVPERGQVTWRTSFSQFSDFSPTVLNDGRVLFTSPQKAAAGTDKPAESPLLAANWDGTGLNLFCGSRQGAAFKTMAAESPDRTLVFVESERGSGLGGRLARVFFRRPLHSYEALSRGEGWYLNPRPLPDGRLAISYAAGQASYGIYLFDFDKGAPETRIFDDPGYEDVDPQPLISRPEPQGLISSVVDTLRWGDLQCINVYDSDQPEMARIPQGAIKRVRFVQGPPSAVAAGNGTASAAAIDSGARLMGEAPVEPDGSFFVRVPADTPFAIELLDAKGRTVQQMSRWIWVRPGTSRGCIGCHENKELAPENRVTDALKKAVPHDLRKE